MARIACQSNDFLRSHCRSIVQEGGKQSEKTVRIQKLRVNFRVAEKLENIIATNCFKRQG